MPEYTRHVSHEPEPRGELFFICFIVAYDHFLGPRLQPRYGAEEKCTGFVVWGAELIPPVTARLKPRPRFF